MSFSVAIAFTSSSFATTQKRMIICGQFERRADVRVFRLTFTDLALANRASRRRTLSALGSIGRRARSSTGTSTTCRRHLTGSSRWERRSARASETAAEALSPPRSSIPLGTFGHHVQPGLPRHPCRTPAGSKDLEAALREQSSRGLPDAGRGAGGEHHPLIKHVGSPNFGPSIARSVPALDTWPTDRGIGSEQDAEHEGVRHQEKKRWANHREPPARSFVHPGAVLCAPLAEGYPIPVRI
jgi:hypothetical protein